MKISVSGGAKIFWKKEITMRKSIIFLLVVGCLFATGCASKSSYMEPAKPFATAPELADGEAAIVFFRPS